MAFRAVGVEERVVDAFAWEMVCTTDVRKPVGDTKPEAQGIERIVRVTYRRFNRSLSHTSTSSSFGCEYFLRTLKLFYLVGIHELNDWLLVYLWLPVSDGPIVQFFKTCFVEVIVEPWIPQSLLSCQAPVLLE